jgi:transposase
MEGMFSYTQAAMERTMKVQEVILRAMAKKITWWQAAEIIGISDRQMRRWHERYEEFGFRGLFDRRRGKPSPKKVPLAVVEKVLGLYREKYFDLNVRHFHEKLQEEHQVEISYSWVKGLLQGAGMVAKGRKRGIHRQQRPRSVPHPTGNATLGYLIAEHDEFSMNTRSAPCGILSHHLEDKLAYLLGHRPSPDALTHTRHEPPIQLKAGTMPTHNGIGRYDN